MNYWTWAREHRPRLLERIYLYNFLVPSEASNPPPPASNTKQKSRATLWQAFLGHFHFTLWLLILTIIIFFFFITTTDFLKNGEGKKNPLVLRPKLVYLTSVYYINWNFEIWKFHMFLSVRQPLTQLLTLSYQAAIKVKKNRIPGVWRTLTDQKKLRLKWNGAPAPAAWIWQLVPHLINVTGPHSVTSYHCC